MAIQAFDSIMDGMGEIIGYYRIVGAFFMALNACSVVDFFIFLIGFLRKSESKNENRQNEKEKAFVNFAFHREKFSHDSSPLDPLHLNLLQPIHLSFLHNFFRKISFS